MHSVHGCKIGLLKRFQFLLLTKWSMASGEENGSFSVQDEIPGNVISFHLMPNCLVALISLGPNYRTLAR